jgi:choline dehydrogenase-like flavoprotein
MARLIANPAANWLYSSEPEANTNGRRIPVPRGKLLGGSSSINGMVFVRGQAQDSLRRGPSVARSGRRSRRARSAVDPERGQTDAMRRDIAAVG